VTFELALGDETVTSVTENLATYKQAIADSFINVIIEPNQVEIEVEAVRRSRRLLAGVVLKVTIVTYDIASSQGIQDTLVSTDDDFGTAIANELQNSHGIVTTVTIDAATIDTTLLAQATSPTTSPTAAPTALGGTVTVDSDSDSTLATSLFICLACLVVFFVVADVWYIKYKKRQTAGKGPVAVVVPDDCEAESQETPHQDNTSDDDLSVGINVLGPDQRTRVPSLSASGAPGVDPGS
jgi:hypothetical protein